jgi:AraC-like DNA-binding protein
MIAGMNDTTTLPDLATSLPDWLPAGLAGGGYIISALQPYALRIVELDQPALIVPLRGRKVLHCGQDSLTVGAGHYLMLHRPTKASVQNLTDGGVYRAWCIPFPWRVVDMARTLLDAHTLAPPPGPAATTGALAPLQDDLRRLLALPKTDADAVDAVAEDHALLGLLLALARSGAAQFRLAQDPALAPRIRLLVGADPARAWTSSDIEERLAMSGATLRRRLALEGTSLRTLLRDARLDHGLHLLQTTRRPLKTVAPACGYRSVPSFCRQFVERFGVDPATVANGAA